MQKHELIGKRAVRVDKDGRRMPGEYVVEKVERGYRGGPCGFVELRRTDGRPTKRAEGFSRSRVRIEGVDDDYASLLSSDPDEKRMTDADRLSGIRRILADVLERAVAVRAPLPADLVQRAWRAVEER